jgi:hypothetical protein
VVEMKKNLVAGIFAVGLIAAGGTGFALANVKEKVQDPVFSMQQGMGNSQMTQMMQSVSNGGTQKQNDQSSFEQMLPYMKKMHPNLSDDQLKALYEQMMGSNGACGNGQGMMGTTNSNGQGMMGDTNNNL